ncbi:MAG TPA: hypothetical protein VJ925_08985 [Longimicrobiales bacterium]|nr:hypothetical protein [Longimicrobiales bacterium]
MTEMPQPPVATEPALEFLVARTEGLQPWRRIFHAVSGLMVVFVPFLAGWSRETTLLMLTIALFVGLALDVVRLRTTWVNRVFFRFLSALASPREARGLASSTWYALGALVAFAVYPPPIAGGAIILLALADPAAGVVGRLYGRRRFGKGTVEGTTAFWIVGSAVLVPLVGWPHAVAASAAAALAEIAPGLVDDNLVIPVVAGAVLWLGGATPSVTGFPF